MSLRACLEAPTLLLRSTEDLGVKNRVKERGVIVGGLRGLLLSAELKLGSEGELAISGAVREEFATSSWDGVGVCCAITLRNDALKKDYIASQII